MRSCARPVDAGASPAPTRSSQPRGAGARRAAGSASSATARSMPSGRGNPLCGVVVQRGQRRDAVLVRQAAELAGEAELLQARDLALALDPGGMVLRQRA